MGELWIPDTIAGYEELEKYLDSTREKSESEWVDLLRWYGEHDLYFLHRYISDLGRAVHSTYGTYLYHDQVYVDAARQYERHLEYGTSLDCSSRRSGKSEFRSTTIPIQLMIRYPDISMFIFSVQKDLATRHLMRIMNELERNPKYYYLWPDIFWEDPREESKRGGLMWSRGDGLLIKGRKMNRSTATVEVHALFGGGPIGTGPDCVIADDIERRDRIRTPEAIEDLDTAFSEAISLVTPVVVRKPLVVISNTRFAQNGLIQRIADRYRADNPDKVREYAAELLPEKWEEGAPELPEDQLGPLGGKIQYPFTKSFLEFKYNESEDKAEYALQYALTYRVGELTLDKTKITYYDWDPKDPSKAGSMTSYVCIDPSRGVKDPTAVFVWGLTADKRKVWLDGVKRKMDPTQKEFHETIFNLVCKWEKLSQRLVEVRVEDTANSSWSELIERGLRDRGSYVKVTRVRVPTTQITGRFRSGKLNRVYERWSGMLENGELWFPISQRDGGRGLQCQDEKGGDFDLTHYFFDTEFDRFPGCPHDDLLDAGGMIADPKQNTLNPLQYPSSSSWMGRPRMERSTNQSSWMSAG